MLAAWLLANFRQRQQGQQGATLALLSSTVSSKMLGAIAAQEGAHWEETLTGEGTGSLLDTLGVPGCASTCMARRPVPVPVQTGMRCTPLTQASSGWATPPCGWRSRGACVLSNRCIVR